MIIRLFILVLLISLNSPSPIFSQQKTTIYLFPGQGSDERIFDSLKFAEKFEIVHIEYPIPMKGCSMREFARVVSHQIDTTQKYILIGVSLGGMIISEMNENLNPEQSIIISSAKSRKELPLRYRFQRLIPIYKLVPPKLMLGGAKFLQPIIEPDRNTNKVTFKNMLSAKDPVYMKRTVSMIINWDREKVQEALIHIHGTKDHTIPIRNVKADHIIENGSHMMTLTQHASIQKILSSYLGQ
ncbi:alpha/beta fold hydrolase [Marivirga harenae]|uniref:alpha/beta fold hydrolase n=1 Tax=Marivirga harenae TaxID=2010992 RepID=UPI0026E023FC|nr:alpha/beta hydrolase [Marivirga harenae]WKV11350.1 alpha/beta hydrolase [Marivirga harenae]